LKNIAVVILNWNGIGFLQNFLPSVIQYTDHHLADIYVADNGSTDRSMEWLSEIHPDVKTIILGENYGFAQGYNLALQQISAPYYLLLNSDIEVTENWLEPMYRIMESDQNIAACMPKIKAFHTKSHFEYAGAAGGYIDKYGFPFCRGRIFHHIEEDHGQYDDTREVFWASGACLLIRSDLYVKAGGLDPFFFAHMEEIDLCWRLKNMGYKIMFCHESTVFHLGGGTLPKKNHRKTYLNFRNNLILLIKNLTPRKYKRTLITRTLLDKVAAFYFLAKLEIGGFHAVLKAYCSVLANLRRIRKSRQAIRKEIQLSHHDEIYPKSIVLHFFLKGKRKFKDLPRYF